MRIHTSPLAGSRSTPGGRFAEHLLPFRAATEAGTSQIMPYYGMPVGTAYEEVGFAFNAGVITGLLRGELGFDGNVCTDWGVLTDIAFYGEPRPARAWGVERLSPQQRARRALDAGCDQFGGEACPDSWSISSILERLASGGWTCRYGGCCGRSSSSAFSAAGTSIHRPPIRRWAAPTPGPPGSPPSAPR